MNTPACNAHETRPTTEPITDLTAHAIGAVQLGRPDGWRFLHDRYRSQLCSLVRRHAGRRLLGREDIDDLVAEVLLAMFQALPRMEYRGPAAFGGWIKRLTLNTLAARANYHGALKRGVRSLSLTVARCDEGDADDGCARVPEETVPSPDPGPLAAVQRLDDRRLLMACVDQLAVGDRLFVQRLLAHGVDMAAIGGQLGISTDAARMRWLRLRRKLRAMGEGRRVAA